MSFRDLHHEASALRRILEVARRLAEPFELRELLAQVIDAGRDVLNADRGSVFLYDAATRELYTVVAHGVTILGPTNLPSTAAVDAIRLSRRTLAVIRGNLFWAFAYNALGIPLAAGVLYPLTGALLSPMLAAAAMSLSSVSVIANALRLRSVRL